MKLEDLKIEIPDRPNPGGQSVGVITSDVSVTHIPTGTTVVCRIHRSQKKNKDAAIAVLENSLKILGYVEPIQTVLERKV